MLAAPQGRAFRLSGSTWAAPATQARTCGPSRATQAPRSGADEKTPPGWFVAWGATAALALRSLSTKRQYGNGGGGSYRSAEEQAERKARKDERLKAQFWSQRRRAVSSRIVRNERYWMYEERRLFKQEHVSRGINFDKYDSIPVELTGGLGTEKPMESFSEIQNMFTVQEQLMKNIEKCGYDKPTPVQKHALPAAMLGTDVMCTAQTGSGKTAAFLVPTIKACLDAGPQETDATAPVAPRAVIMAPTRELCQQITVEAKRLCFMTNVKPVEIFGGADQAQQLSALAQGCDIAICTPGRLKDFLSQGFLTMEKVTKLTLDEADRMLDMGFEPQIREIIEEFGMPFPGHGEEDRQTTMFSATFPQDMQNMALDFLDPGYMWIAVGQVGAASANVEQRFVDCCHRDKYDATREAIDELNDVGTLVFSNTKIQVDDIVRRLNDDGIRARAVHGGMAQAAREGAVGALRRGAIKVLVATDVAARGLDLPGIGHVVNYDLPNNGDDYVHRIGRTGRIGNKGVSTSMVGWDESSLKSIVEQMKSAHEADEDTTPVPEWLADKAYGGGGGRGGGAPPPMF